MNITCRYFRLDLKRYFPPKKNKFASPKKKKQHPKVTAEEEAKQEKKEGKTKLLNKLDSEVDRLKLAFAEGFEKTTRLENWVNGTFPETMKMLNGKCSGCF